MSITSRVVAIARPVVFKRWLEILCLSGRFFFDSRISRIASSTDCSTMLDSIFTDVLFDSFFTDKSLDLDLKKVYYSINCFFL